VTTKLNLLIPPLSPISTSIKLGLISGNWCSSCCT